jgi:hypothetical protein
VGDRTGAGDYATRNDIAIIWPLGKAHIILNIPSGRTDKDAKYDDALIAAPVKAAISALGADLGNNGVSGRHARRCVCSASQSEARLLIPREMVRAALVNH